jgi:hypothetical protein
MGLNHPLKETSKSIITPTQPLILGLIPTVPETLYLIDVGQRNEEREGRKGGGREEGGGRREERGGRREEGEGRWEEEGAGRREERGGSREESGRSRAKPT